MLGLSKDNPLPLPRFDGKAPKTAVITARYLDDLATALVAGATETLKDVASETSYFNVPGVLELAPALRIAIGSGKFDCYIVLGAVVEEDLGTDTLYDRAIEAVQRIAAEGHPVGTAILLGESKKQLTKQVSSRKSSVGQSAAAAALHLLSLSRDLISPSTGMGFKPASEHILMAGDPKSPDQA